MLEVAPANTLAMKRRVCVLKAQGKLRAAAKCLNEFLTQFQGDVSAWRELADLQQALGQHAAAAFSFAELIAASPQNFLYHRQYAELMYTLGGADNLRTARKYYAQSLEIKPRGNARALLGLCMCANALAADGGAQRDAEDASINAQLHAYGSAGLARSHHEGACAEALRRVLDRQADAVSVAQQ